MPKTCDKHLAFEAAHADSDQCPYCAINVARDVLRAWQVRWLKLRYDVERAEQWPLKPGWLDRLEQDSPVPDTLVTPIR